MCKTDIGALIRRQREKLGLTYEEIGKAVGVGKSTVRKWETGMIKNMRRDKIAALAEILQIPPSALIDRDDYSPAALEVAAAYDQADYPTQHAVRRVLSLPVNEPEILVRAAHRTTRSLDDINRPDTLED